VREHKFLPGVARNLVDAAVAKTDKHLTIEDVDCANKAAKVNGTLDVLTINIDANNLPVLSTGVNLSVNESQRADESFFVCFNYV
jgi:hypothetical protein